VGNKTGKHCDPMGKRVNIVILGIRVLDYLKRDQLS